MNAPGATLQFDPDCTRCERLADFLSTVRTKYPEYHARPVPGFGERGGRVLVVGLAPGMHGANASGRPFTGDHAGILLYKTLHAFGFATAAESVSADDNLELLDCRITNAVKCLPPENKPTGAEVRQCSDYLAGDLAEVPNGGVLIALGKIAHDAVLRCFGLKLSEYRFAHAAEHQLPNRQLVMIDSYHCSRYNTQTGRLTETMFAQVFEQARARIGAAA